MWVGVCVHWYHGMKEMTVMLKRQKCWIVLPICYKCSNAHVQILLQTSRTSSVNETVTGDVKTSLFVGWMLLTQRR